MLSSKKKLLPKNRIPKVNLYFAIVFFPTFFTRTITTTSSLYNVLFSCFVVTADRIIRVDENELLSKFKYPANNDETTTARNIMNEIVTKMATSNIEIYTTDDALKQSPDDNLLSVNKLLTSTNYKYNMEEYNDIIADNELVNLALDILKEHPNLNDPIRSRFISRYLLFLIEIRNLYDTNAAKNFANSLLAKLVAA
ncbi:hypothetical protein HT594_00107 [Phenacoccus solenopsis nudivirus]|nr:hypothetical protein HT594_00107 [Phenacoccus solenopsis nudivirus]